MYVSVYFYADVYLKVQCIHPHRQLLFVDAHSHQYNRNPLITVFCCLDLSSSDGCTAAQVSRQLQLPLEARRLLLF